MDKWYKVCIFCLWFYWRKLLVDDQFDDIGIVITNSKEDINLDVMNINWKTFKSPTLLLSSQSLFDLGNKNSSPVVDHDNE